MIISADFHIHVGFANNKFIKIPSSKNLTLTNIFYYSKNIKGLNAIAIVDFLCNDVLFEINNMLRQEKIRLIKGNLYFEDLLIIPAMELEIKINNKGVHFIILFKSVNSANKFKDNFINAISNFNFSCPQYVGDLNELIDYINRNGDLLIPAHVFTPFKGFYSASKSLKELNGIIYASEMGLSADRYMSLKLIEQTLLTLLSNSDAHSLDNIAREFNLIDVHSLDISSVFNAIINNKIVANFGLIPKLGKYHMTYCNNCNTQIEINEPSKLICPKCNKGNIVLGVSQRIEQLKNNNDIESLIPYYCTLPYKYINGLGKTTIEKLISFFENEINMHIKLIELYNTDSFNLLQNIVSRKSFLIIKAFYDGNYNIKYGSGGYFGKIIPNI
ncbi:histidinol-phosphatase [Caldicellulosiruptoraceae bacterium PP1]